MDTSLVCPGALPSLTLLGTTNRRNTKEITIKHAGGIGCFYFLMGDGTEKRLLIAYALPSSELFGNKVAVPWATTGPETLRLEPPELRTSLRYYPKAAQAQQGFWGSSIPLPLPPLHSRGDWDLRDRKLFGPQSYFQYFLWERKWKLIQEQGFTKEAICLLDYLFACQSLSYGTG